MKHICDYPDSHIVRSFDIAAISLPIVYNKYGDHDPNGLLYVLKEDAERIEQEAWKRFRLSPPQPYEEGSRWCCGQMWAMKSASTFITV